MRTRKILMRMGVLVVVLGLAYGGLDLAGAAPPGGISGDVTVDNTATNAVPVQQQGTSTVAGTVGIDPAANTVQLPPTDTVQTSAEDNPAFQAVTASCTANGQSNDLVASCNPASTSAGGLVVPAGKELVITSVSMTADVPLADVLTTAFIEHDVVYADGSSNTGDFWLPIGSPQTVGGSNGDLIYNAGLATQFYESEGGSLLCEFGVASGNGAAGVSGTCSIDGYFVNLPPGR